MNKRLILAVLAILLTVGGYLLWPDHHASHAPHAEGDGHDHDDSDSDDDHGESAEISDAVAQSMGIEMITAGLGTIRETVRLSGRVALNQNRSAEVKARFPGVVRGVFKQIGDPVTRGEKLASVESNESLQVYTVPAPLDGVVLSRSISVGDTASDAPIFVVADLNSLWAEFFVFASDMDTIRQGQGMIVRSLDDRFTTPATLQTIQPTAEASSQTVLARAELDNTAGHWRPGMTVKGDVIVQEAMVEVAVPMEAIQSFEGKQVVFVKHGERYTPTPITLGRTDADMAEVTAGLANGAQVAGRGSFIVKAEIGKAAAGHEH